MPKRGLKFLLAAIILLITTVAAGAQTTAPWFFAILSDPQLGMYAKDRNFTQETANLEFAVASLNRLHPRFVVVCGDLVNRTGDPAEIAEYKRILKQLDPAIPVFNVAGNHDVGNIPTPQLLQAYRSAFGRDYYTFSVANITGIVLNSSLIGAPEKAPDESRQQQQWLERTLKEAATHPDRQIVVFQHIPYFDHTPDEKNDYFNIPEPARRTYLDLLERANVHYVFAGHFHRNAGGADNSLTEMVTGATGMPIGESQSGLRIVTVNGNQLQSRFYCFGAIPNQIVSPDLPPTSCAQQP